jgi:hypothetical protein
MVCLWRVAGRGTAVKAVVAEVEGYRKRCPLVSTAGERSGLPILEVFCARFRQEDGFRDRKHRLGWEEGRAWTRQPLEVTTQALFVCLTLLRLVPFGLEGGGETDWWWRPPWNRHKDRPRVLDVERLLGRHREEIQQLLAAWLENAGKATPASSPPVVG